MQQTSSIQTSVAKKKGIFSVASRSFKIFHLKKTMQLSKNNLAKLPVIDNSAVIKFLNNSHNPMVNHTLPLHEYTAFINKFQLDYLTSMDDDKAMQYLDSLYDIHIHCLVAIYANKYKLVYTDIEIMLKFMFMLRRDFQTSRWSHHRMIIFAASQVKEKRSFIHDMVSRSEANEITSKINSKGRGGVEKINEEDDLRIYRTALEDRTDGILKYLARKVYGSAMIDHLQGPLSRYFDD
ncbi:hypothetical protein V1514DRAFT_366517 [Lipomyces japonicus]|uniref:uncharacterized protein n=1 Tax=Lipomyces japonicus TaxID=56871 RepID=UPI0034CD8A73